MQPAESFGLLNFVDLDKVRPGYSRRESLCPQPTRNEGPCGGVIIAEHFCNGRPRASGAAFRSLTCLEQPFQSPSSDKLTRLQAAVQLSSTTLKQCFLY